MTTYISPALETPATNERAIAGTISHAWARGRFWVETAAVFAAGALLVAILQRLTGAWQASFGLYPDEPSHYLSCVLIRDYLTSGFHTNPVAFAIHYYSALPFFAIGYWPPAFYAIGALWMLAFGTGHASALFLTTVVTGLIGATIFKVVRRESGFLGAVLGALLFSIVPQVVRNSSMFMLDLPVALFSLWALLALIQFYKDPARPRYAMLFAILASLAFLTKYSGGFVFLLPVFMLLGSRKWSLLRNRWFWAQPAIAAAICGPWVWFTHRLIDVGLPAAGDPIHGYPVLAFGSFLMGLVRVAGPALVASAAAGILLTAGERCFDVELFMYAAAPLCLVLFLLATPVDAENRYFLPAIPPMVLLVANCFKRLEFSHLRGLGTLLPALLVVAETVRCAAGFPHFPPDRLRPIVEYVNSHPKWKNASILLPTDYEGPAIAEFAEYASHRPSYVLLRPTKIIGISNWWGIERTRYSSAAQLESALTRHALDLIVIDRRPGDQKPVDGLIQSMVDEFPAKWTRLAVLKPPCEGGISGHWDVYASTEPFAAGSDQVFSNRTLSRVKLWQTAEK